MSLPKHTKKQLIHLAPEEMLFKHVDSLNLPEYVKIELWEQKNFISDKKKEEMCNWNYNQFLDWYDI